MVKRLISDKKIDELKNKEIQKQQLIIKLQEKGLTEEEIKILTK